MCILREDQQLLQSDSKFHTVKIESAQKQFLIFGQHCLKWNPNIQLLTNRAYKVTFTAQSFRRKCTVVALLNKVFRNIHYHII